MDLISSPAPVQSPNGPNILHTVRASLDPCTPPCVVHLAQYDDSFPLIAVRLFYAGKPYPVPTGAAVNLRVRKPDRTYLYTPVFGLDSARSTAFIQVSQQLTAAPGTACAMLEVVVNHGVAGTCPMILKIAKNPLPFHALQSSDDFSALTAFVQEAQTAQQTASKAANTAQEIADSLDWQNKITQIMADGSILETTEKQETLTTFGADGSITEQRSVNGEIVKTRVTAFDGNTIREVIS